MNYRTEILNGYTAVVGHIFKAEEIQVGSRWVRADGFNHIVTVEGLNSYGSTDPWIEVVYSWELEGVKYTNDRDAFAFQCRYCLVLEELK